MRVLEPARAARPRLKALIFLAFALLHAIAYLAVGAAFAPPRTTGGAVRTVDGGALGAILLLPWTIAATIDCR